MKLLEMKNISKKINTTRINSKSDTAEEPKQ